MPMQRGEALLDLGTAAVPVHIAKTANVHEDVKAELLPRVEAAQQFVMRTTMVQPKIDNLIAPR